jgi:myo-inositol-1(or 4)-monophosphatase
LTPKNEWDVAAGAALVASAGGFVATLDSTPLRCNNRNPLLTGLMASGPFLKEELLSALRDHLPAHAADSSRS